MCAVTCASAQKLDKPSGDEEGAAVVLFVDCVDSTPSVSWFNSCKKKRVDNSAFCGVSLSQVLVLLPSSLNNDIGVWC